MPPITPTDIKHGDIGNDKSTYTRTSISTPVLNYMHVHNFYIHHLLTTKTIVHIPYNGDIDM